MKKIFTLLCVALTVNTFAQTNLVPNPDFETDDSGWTNSGADTRTIVSPGHESTQAFQVTGAINKGVQYVTDGTTELQAGDYIISFWAKGTAGELAKFKVKFGDASTKTVVGTAFTASDAWEFFEFSFTLDAIKTIDKFILQCNSNVSPSLQTFVADDLFFGEDLDGPDPIEPVDPDFTAFPFTEDFEAAGYVTDGTLASYDGTTESDSWTVDNQVFDRFWRGTNSNGYTCSVDDDAYAGSKAMKLAVTNKIGTDLRLRTVNIPTGSYDISFYAKTDVAGTGNARLGFSGEEGTWNTLTTDYIKYTGTFEVITSETNGTSRLIIFYTAGILETDNLAYNIWIDDITITESSATAIEDLAVENFKIYPNPVSSILNIQSTESIERVEIYNLVGSKVLSAENTNGSVDVSELARGLYIISAKVGSKTVQQKFNKK